MAQPTWVTGSGNLGTIPEGKFYRATLEAYDPDFPSDSSKVQYKKISGTLPHGIQINSNGMIEGTPVAMIQGTPLAVSHNVTSNFSIRAYTERVDDGIVIQDRLNDRTFIITVTGQDAPEFITPSGELGRYFDGQLINTQIEFRDTDPSDTAIVSLVSGALPNGVSVSVSGLINGYIAPETTITGANAGWENEEWDSQPLQFNTGTISKNYEFTLRITDGIDYNLRSFSIFVGVLTADATANTVDSDINTADTVTRAPFIYGSTNLGTFLHDNEFAYQIVGEDYNDDILNYSVDDVNLLPDGLTLDVGTGFLHGMLSNVGLTEHEYNFTITVYKKNTPTSSNTYDYSLKVIGDINSGVTWDTTSELGTIDNGDISVFSVRAITSHGLSLQYRLKQGGVYNKLPQGLTLLGSGNIIGKVDYSMFGVVDRNPTSDSSNTSDSSLLTVDMNGNTDITFDNNTTVFDSKFTFTVEAFTSDGTISTFRKFIINVNNKYDLPSHTIRIDALPPQNSRNLINTLLKNQDIIKQELLYRSDDPFFGVSSNVSFIHAYGLSPETLETYIESVTFNHYDKRLVLGDIQTAHALDDSGNIIYEVVYSSIVDNLISANGDGVSSTVSSHIGDVYPNSLYNMRNSIINKVGQISSKLPRWMLSKQKNGNILGFTPAWVIAYTLPGQSDLISYNIKTDFSGKLNEINFYIDRYILESQSTKNWDAEDQQWYPTDSTSFDIYNHDISADSIGTTSDTNTITTDKVNSSTTETTFDKKSCVFIGVRANKADISIKTADTIDISADNGIADNRTTFEITDRFNEYLLFPKRDIINTKQIT